MCNQVDHLGVIIIRELTAGTIILKNAQTMKTFHPKLFSCGWEIEDKMSRYHHDFLLLPPQSTNPNKCTFLKCQAFNAKSIKFSWMME